MHPMATELRQVYSLQERIRQELKRRNGLVNKRRGQVPKRNIPENSVRITDIADAEPVEELNRVNPPDPTNLLVQLRVSALPPWRPWRISWHSRGLSTYAQRSIYNSGGGGLYIGHAAERWAFTISRPWNYLILALIAFGLIVNYPITLAVLLSIIIIPVLHAFIVKFSRIRKNRIVERENALIEEENEQKRLRNLEPQRRNKERISAELYRRQIEANNRVDAENARIAAGNQQLNEQIAAVDAEIEQLMTSIEEHSKVISTSPGGIEANWVEVDSRAILGLVNLLETGQAVSLDMACHIFNEQSQRELDEKKRAQEELRLQREEAQWKAEKMQAEKEEREALRRHREDVLNEQRKRTKIAEKAADDEYRRAAILSGQLQDMDANRRAEAQQAILWQDFGR